VRSVGPVGPVGFGERGFDLFCWLSRVLVSPAGSIGSVETLKRSRYIPPELGEDPPRIPRTFVASGGHCYPPLRSSPFGTCYFSPQYGEAQKPDIRRKAAEVHGTNDYLRGFNWEKLGNTPPIPEKKPVLFTLPGESWDINAVCSSRYV